MWSYSRTFILSLIFFQLKNISSQFSCTTNVVIQNGVTTIPTNAFYQCTSMISVTIPSSVISIQTGAFFQCTGLQSVTILSTSATIEGSAFYQCTGLQTVMIQSCIGLTFGANPFGQGCIYPACQSSGLLTCVSAVPSKSPTVLKLPPSLTPSNVPLPLPTLQPIVTPLSNPSGSPVTTVPSTYSTSCPSMIPSSRPSLCPSAIPSTHPSTMMPRQSLLPSLIPSIEPMKPPFPTFVVQNNSLEPTQVQGDSKSETVFGNVSPAIFSVIIVCIVVGAVLLFCAFAFCARYRNKNTSSTVSPLRRWIEANASKVTVTLFPYQQEARNDSISGFNTELDKNESEVIVHSQMTSKDATKNTPVSLSGHSSYSFEFQM